MDAIELNEMQYAIDILRGWRWLLDDFELSELGLAGPFGDLVAPASPIVRIRRKSTRIGKDYPTERGNAWVIAFQSDLLRGHFS